MNTSKYTHITMQKRDITSNNMSPREDCNVELQSPEGDISQTFNTLEVDSFHLVKNVPRTHLSQQLLGDDDDSESEFDDFEEDSGWFATYVQDITPTKKRLSSVSLKAAAPVKKRSSAKQTIPLKEATGTSRRSSAKTGGNRANILLNKMKRTTRKQGMRERVRDTRGRDSLNLHHDRLLCSKNEMKRNTRTQDIRERVRDTLGRDSLSLTRDRMQCSKSAAKTTH